MINKILFILSLGIFTISVVSAETIVPGGNVSGTWTEIGSPYLIQGDVTIPADSTLIIEPGVEVNFEGNYTFSINGFLQAVGTATDSIHFTASTDWGGIIFTNAPDSSHLEYCILDSVASLIAPVFCQNSNPVISHSTIKHNWGQLDCGGISLVNNSNPRLLYCTISNNNTPSDGSGGIRLANSSPEISHCSIIGNSGGYGGGIYVIGGNPVISHSTISGNSSVYGGGIYVGAGSSLIINRNTISHNDASWDGGGIFISSSTGVFILTKCMILSNWSANGGSGIHIVNADSVVITSSLFDNNRNGYQEGAIYSVNCAQLIIDHCDFVKNRCFESLLAGGITLNGSTNLTLTNCIFRGQIGTDIYFNSYSSASVSYCDFYNSFQPFNFPPPGLGELTTVNANGDSCDVFYNIYLDPLFVDFTSGDYHLTESSPCIDAGDPASPLDPDNTISDMGAWYYHQILITVSDTLLDFGIVDIGQQMDLPLTIRNGGTAALRLQNVSNINSVFTHNWSIGDSLILPNDSLIISVTFTPMDTNLVVDTLLIENNDGLLYVQLSGKGKIVSGIKDESELPTLYALYPAYPNPFNPSTTIEFDLPKTSNVTLKIFNTLGEEVAILVSDKLSAGTYTYEWDAGNLASGVYLYRLQAGDHIETRKMMLMR